MVPAGSLIAVVPPTEEFPSYKPSAWYFREALRNARTKEEAVDVGLQVVLEVETLKEFIRDHGLIPPKSYIMEAEAEEKGWPIQEAFRFDV